MPDTTVQTMPIACSGCHAVKQVKPTARGLARVPKGWHRLGDETFCAACWGQRYMLRAVTFPVVGPIDGTWPELRAALRTVWAETTAAANWMVTELAKADVERTPAETRMPAMPRSYLYPRTRQRFAGLPSQAAAALEQSVQGKYRAKRLEVIWRSAASLPRYRYPVPFASPNQGWSAEMMEYPGTDGQVSRVPVVKVRIGDRRWTLRLRGGRNRGRQFASLQKIMDGSAVKGELAIYRVRDNDATGDCNGVAQRANGGGNMVRYRVMAKMVAWLPRPENDRERIGTLDVRIGSHALFVAVAPDRERPWVLKDNQVRRWIKVHQWHLAGISEDTKAERRRPKRRKVQMHDRLDALTTRHRNRIDTFCHRAAKMLVNYADRSGLAEIRYDDSDRRYFTSFPWAKLRELIAQKCDAAGLRFVASGEDVENDSDASPDATAESE